MAFYFCCLYKLHPRGIMFVLVYSSPGFTLYSVSLLLLLHVCNQCTFQIITQTGFTSINGGGGKSITFVSLRAAAPPPSLCELYMSNIPLSREYTPLLCCLFTTFTKSTHQNSPSSRSEHFS